MIKIAPSILAGDLSIIKEEIKDVEKGGAAYIHIDVMDGHFVPNFSVGPQVIQAIKRVTRLPLDLHLMIENPQRYIDIFVNSGADLISIHQETCPHANDILKMIKENKAKAGLAINPSTPVDTIKKSLPLVDYVVIMTVNPGFTGQSFINDAVKKIEQVARLRADYNLTFEIQADGGINSETAKYCADAGADILVAGSSIFNQSDRKKAIEEIMTTTKSTR